MTWTCNRCHAEPCACWIFPAPTYAPVFNEPPTQKDPTAELASAVRDFTSAVRTFEASLEDIARKTDLILTLLATVKP